MMPALSACTSSPAPGTSDDDRHSAVADDVDLGLTDADGLDDHRSSFRRRRARRRISRGAGQAAQVAARRHAADEHALVAGVRLHAHAVAENRAAGERAGRIDGDDSHARARRAQFRVTRSTSVLFPRRAAR